MCYNTYPTPGLVDFFKPKPPPPGNVMLTFTYQVPLSCFKSKQGPAFICSREPPLPDAALARLPRVL